MAGVSVQQKSSISVIRCLTQHLEEAQKQRAQPKSLENIFMELSEFLIFCGMSSKIRDQIVYHS